MKIIIQTSPKESVEIGILTSLISKLTLATDHAYTLREAYKNEWNKKSRGYTLIKKPTSTTLDESLI